MRYIKKRAFVWVLCLACSTYTLAQTSISKSVIAGGGGRAESEQFRIATTIGQPIIGITSVGNTRANLGFWFGNSDLFTDVRYISDNEDGFTLKQNFPNPFRFETKIEFTVPVKTWVHLNLLDHQGQLITTLVKEEMKQGSYEVDLLSKDLPSGVYYYQMLAEGYRGTRKCIIMK
jgi:hypothetical protein